MFDSDGDGFGDGFGDLGSAGVFVPGIVVVLFFRRRSVVLDNRRFAIDDLEIATFIRVVVIQRSAITTINERFDSRNFHRDVHYFHRALATLLFESMTGERTFVPELLLSDDDKSVLVSEVAEAGVDETLSFFPLNIRERVDVQLTHGREEEAIQSHVSKTVFTISVFEKFQTDTAELVVANDEDDEERYEGVQAAVFHVVVFKRAFVEIEVVVPVAVFVELLKHFVRKRKPVDSFERQGVETHAEAFVAFFLGLGVDKHVGVMGRFEKIEDEEDEIF